MAWSDATIFDAGSVAFYWLRCTTLANGIFVVTWEETVGTDDGKFAIYDTDGAEVKAPTQFHANATNYIDVAALSNGNFFIIYSDDADSDRGKFVIYDSTGTIVKSETQFEAHDTAYIEAVTVAGDKVLVLYRHNNADTYFVIFNADGTEDTGPTQIAGIDATHKKGILLDNGNVLFTFVDADTSNHLYYTIRTAAGAEVVAPALLKATANYNYQNLAILSDSNVFMVYGDASTSCSYQIRQQDGTPEKAEAVITANTATSPICGKTDDDRVFVAFYQSTAPAGGYSMLFTEAGAIDTAAALFNSSTTWMMDSTVSGEYHFIPYIGAGSDGVFRTYTTADAPSIPSDQVAIRRLVAVGNDKVYYEDV